MGEKDSFEVRLKRRWDQVSYWIDTHGIEILIAFAIVAISLMIYFHEPTEAEVQGCGCCFRGRG